MSLSIVVNALGRGAKNRIKDIEDMSDVLAATQRVVDTLTPPQGGRYIVALKDAQTASTDYTAHRIVVTAKPLHDSSLSQAEVAEVLVGLTAHEIGHTIYDGPISAAAIQKHNPHAAYHRIHNVLADHRLEKNMRVRYPMIGPAFTFTGKWVAKWYDYKRRPAVAAAPVMTANERFNFAIAAIRYPGGVRWSNDPLTRAERRRWQEWAETYTADLTFDLHLAGCDVAWAWIGEPNTPEPSPEDEEEPPIIDGNDGEDIDLTPDDEDEDEDDDWDEDGEDEDWDDDGEPNPGPTDDEPEPEPTDDVNPGPVDEPTDEKPDGGEPKDDVEPGETGKGESDTDPAPEWNESDTATDLHDHVEKEANQDYLSDRIDTFNSAVRVTFGAYGSMTAKWQ